MATDSSALAWTIPWREGPGGLQSLRSQESQKDLEIEQQLSGLRKMLSVQSLSRVQLFETP